jgi:hypothetical protein
MVAQWEGRSWACRFWTGDRENRARERLCRRGTRTFGVVRDRESMMSISPPPIRNDWTEAPG